MRRIFLMAAALAVLLFFSFAVVYGDTPQKVAYITIDDGPTLNTPRFIELLAKYGGKATFFVLNDRVKLYPEYVNLMINEGHAVGLHGTSHDIQRLYSSLTEPIKEMNEENRTLYAAAGIRSCLVRMPYGSAPYMSKKHAEFLTAAGYKVWDWTVDPQDSLGETVPVSRTLEYIAHGVKKAEVPVILLHDRKSTANAFEEILKYLKSEGYEMRAISEAQTSINKFDRLK